jgi:hypothetical protein
MLDYSRSFEYYSNMPLAGSAAEQLHVLPTAITEFAP